MSGEIFGTTDRELGKLHMIYVGAFTIFILAAAILEQLGATERTIVYLYMAFTLGTYACIGIASRTMRLAEFHVAGHRVPPFYNGMAIGADWMSGTIFIGFAGAFYTLGYDSLAYVVGWTGGFVLAAILFAPYLRKLGVYSVSDFLNARFDGETTRVLGVCVLLCCSFIILVAQLAATGIIAARFLDLPFEIAVAAGVLGILVCSVLGGMHSITWTQSAQYIVIAAAFLIPVMWLSGNATGMPIPHLSYADALKQVSAIELGISGHGAADPASLMPDLAMFQTFDRFNFLALIFCLMAGTATLPHILMRYFTAATVQQARVTPGFGLVATMLLLLAAPAYGAFVKLEIFTNVVGTPVGNLADDAAWIFNWGQIQGRELIYLCGEPARSFAQAVLACGGDHIIAPSDLKFDPDMIVLGAPDIAGMPFVITAMVAAGALAAILSTATGLVFAIGSAMSHDLYFAILSKHAPTSRQLLVARICMIAAAIAAAYVAIKPPADILTLASWAFSLAAAGLFPALALGIFWKRCTSSGAIAGMICGFGVCLAYLAAAVFGPDLIPSTGDEIRLALPGITDGILAINAGIIGVPAGLLAMIAVSLATPAPSDQTLALLDEIRRPGGETIMKRGRLVR